MDIRDAIDADAAVLTEIYNHEVANGTALWNVKPVDEAQRLAFLADRRAAGLPVLVAEIDGEVAGYASYGPFRPQDGFHQTMEHSVYLRPTFQGRGIGPALMEALIVRARDGGVHALVGAIDGVNTGSIRLHERLGFTEVGRLPQTGQKFGRWLDLVLMQLTLDDRPAP
ncbi:N-acetyltransferase [Marivivens donghaensis]|uniref:N-acetyltransferase n=1 Tax=Marivivens donghaensis TaxID=1699413 RepID=A0ABX0VXY7_9RHOB|nr:GNAT family N-acetyltransferase [Marivivens donghaensis]NIY72679.1 N-acetyltransferase [Marivivens donghaensis]